ncbi:hypothetical protein [Protofrankia symbiont of Coriaria ruscifolia]|uniref:hypothetical protein n=1 Tax=Protofrankia symbiont of Coriaria ruscifolia TaxID=1306542 RepID=UPI001041B36B|nr:hypothetical protein [Protofrankia symbiont of Coriaria ruscifolia]
MTSQQDGGPNADPIPDGLRELIDELAQAVGGVTNALMLAPQIFEWFVRRQQHQIDQAAQPDQAAARLATAQQALREVLHPAEAAAPGLGSSVEDPYAAPNPAAPAPVRVDLSDLAETLEHVCGVRQQDPVTVLHAAYRPGLAGIKPTGYAAELDQRLLGLLTPEQRHAAGQARAERQARAAGPSSQRTGRVRSGRRGGGYAAGEAARRRTVAEDAVRTVLAGDPARAETVISSEGFGAVAHRLAQVCRTLGLTPVEAVGQAVFMFSRPRGLGDVSIENAAAVLHARLGWLVDPSGIPDWLAAHRVDPLVRPGTDRNGSRRPQRTSPRRPAPPRPGNAPDAHTAQSASHSPHTMRGQDDTIIHGEVIDTKTIDGPAWTAGRPPRDPDPGRVRATTYPGPPRPRAWPPGGKRAQAQPAAPVRRALPTTVSRGR